MFQYEVMDEKQAMQERFQLLPKGEYDAVIDASEDKQSSSGNPMMAMTLTVYDTEGRQHSVRDFLVFTKSMMWKAIHCAESSGTIGAYNNGKFCSNEVIGKSVRVRIGVEDGKEIPSDRLQGKASGAKYPDKNKVEDYIKRSGNANGIYEAQKNNADPVDEDVPF